MKIPRRKSSKIPPPVEADDRPRHPKGKWPAGAAANPKGGVPKEYTWASIIKEIGVEQDIEGVQRKERVARKVWELAELGVPWAVDFCADREDGKPKQQHEITAPRGRGVDLKKVPTDVLERVLRKLADS